VRPALACLLVAVSPIFGCGTRTTTPSTELAILAVNPTVGRALFHLRCEPAHGDLPNAASACAALASQPSLVTKPKPFVCYGGTTSWWDVTISGRLDGHPIRRAFSTCWTPQMATIHRLGLADDALEKHLVTRREPVLGGVPGAFPSGLMRPGS
jgi:hypothetical protein